MVMEVILRSEKLWAVCLDIRRFLVIKITKSIKKTKFGAEDENSLTGWMERNLLFAYLANDKSKELESFLIDSLLPPLNVEGSKAATLQRVHELRCDK